MRGADKLLELVDGAPQLARIARAAIATGAPVMVCLPPDRPARLRVIEGLTLSVVIIADADSGMSASLRAGAAAAGGVPGLMILPADMPELDAEDLNRMITAFRGDPSRIWRATSADGRPGHPVIFPQSLLPDLAHVSGDEGGRQVIRDHAGLLSLCPLPAFHAVTDLDTPEDWAAWRAR